MLKIGYFDVSLLSQARDTPKTSARKEGKRVREDGKFSDERGVEITRPARR